MRILKYSFEEAWASMKRSARSVVLSIMTIAAALLVLGAFLLVSTNLWQLVALWSSAAEISVYLKDDVREADRAAIARLLKESRLVAASEYLSKTDALARFKREFPDLAALAAGASENPFPASFEVRVRAGAGLNERMQQLVTALTGAAGVADVRYDRRWLERLLVAVDALQWVGVIFGAVLVVAAVLTVANVLRLAFHARREEIEIMELVGAPLAFVRGPFVLEGVMQGGIAAIVALALLWGAFLFGRAQYGDALAQTLGLPTLRFLAPQLCGLLLAGGMLVGCMGGFLAARHGRSDRALQESDAAPA